MVALPTCPAGYFPDRFVWLAVPAAISGVASATTLFTWNDVGALHSTVT